MCGVWSVARVRGEGMWRGCVARACGEGHLRGEGDRHNGVVHVQVILLVHEDVVGRVVQRRQLGQAPHSARVNRSGVGLSVGGGGAGCGGRGACVGDGGRLSLGRGEQPLLQLPAPVPVPQRQERGGGGADQDGQGRRPLAHEAHRGHHAVTVDAVCDRHAFCTETKHADARRVSAPHVHTLTNTAPCVS